MRNLKKILYVYFAISIVSVLLFQSAVLLCSAKVYANTIQDTKIPIGYKPVYTISDLAGINSNPSGKYILMNDIDMTKETSPGGSWDKGNGWTPLDAFSGVFDGNGHRIIGMHIYGELDGKAALFSEIPRNYDEDNGNYEYNSTAIIKNLGILNCDIDVKISNITHIGDDDTYVGGIIGCNGGKIENCFVSGKIKAVPNNYCFNMAGGIAGRNQGVITNCYNTADVYTSADNDLVPYVYAGGIAAVNSEKIKNCYNMGKITSPFARHSGAVYANTYSYYDSINPSKYIYFLNASIDNKDDLDGKSLTESQMKYETSFTGFDFNNIWMIDGLSSYSYPQLKSCPQIKIDKLELRSLPDKLIYSQGDKLDLSGAVLSITYENGTVTSVGVDEDMLSGVDMDKPGKQTVVIKYFNKESDFDIEVNEVKATGIELPKTEYFINRYKKLVLNAVIKPDNVTNKTIRWETDNDKVATVTQKGVVYGVNAGTATITAVTENGLVASCVVTVKIPATYIKLNLSDVVLKKGKTKTLKAIVYPLDTTDTVIWTSSNPKIVSVTQNGVIKAKKKGYAIVTAKTTSGKYAYVKVTVKK